jgi:TolB-like protein
MVRPFLFALVSLCLAPAAAAGELRIAVMEFTNHSTGEAKAELEALGKGLQSMLTTDLSQVAAFKLVERQRLQDIRAELKLSRGQEIDKATAVKIGKLAGATHLCSGSFTVVGDRMRIDGRLVSVQSGEVLLAEEIQGEKAMFFELEKALAQKIAAAAGVKLAPKEKAQLGKVHTADFDAFRKFSEGVAAFDDKRYDDAIKALGEASQLDGEFQLANLTLEEYERIAAKVRAQADVAESAADALERMHKQDALKAKQALAARLWALVEKKGGGAAQAERLTATCLLAFLHWYNFYVSAPGLDTFTLERAGDALAKRFYREAIDAYPLVPPLCSRRYYGGSMQDLTVERFDEQMKAHVEAFTTYTTRTTGLSRSDFLRELREEAQWFGSRLHLDDAQLMRLYEQLYQLAAKRDLTDAEREPFEETLAKEARRRLLIDRSTALYVSLSKRSKDASKLRDYADEIEKNRRVQEVVLAKTTSPLAREHWRLDPFTSVELIQNVYGKGQPTAYGLESLHDLRDASAGPFAKYLILGDVPFWVVVKPDGKLLRSGPRKDRLRFDELRYASAEDQARGRPVGALLVLDGARRREVGLRLRVDPRLPADFLHRGAAPPRAEVGVAFGLTDVEVLSPDDPQARPLRGMAVLVGREAVRLVTVESDRRRETFDVAVKEEQRVELPAGKPFDLAVRVGGGVVAVTVDGKAVKLRLPGDPEGAFGLVFRGKGYAGVSGLALER